MTSPPPEPLLAVDDQPPDAGPAPKRRGPPTWVVALAVVVGVVLGAAVAAVAADLTREADRVALEIVSTDVARIPGTMVVPTPPQRTLDSYAGYGTWIDVFDFSPAYDEPTLFPADLAEMAELGVSTLYMQAARLDTRTPGGLEDPWLLAEFLLAAHAVDIDVVAWYLPKWSADDSDLERVRLLADFEVLGNKFDGVAIDIEWTGGEIDIDTRNQRLVSLSAAASDSLGSDPLAAIVFPPVITDVINPDLWPDFPWTQIADDYDVWMPMSYWSFRSQRSGYADGYTYNEESTRLLRENLGDPDALVHGIGGIGGVDGVNDLPDPPEPLTYLLELDAFVESLLDTGSIGGSIYDWDTLEPEARVRLASLFAEGSGSLLPGVP